VKGEIYGAIVWFLISLYIFIESFGLPAGGWAGGKGIGARFFPQLISVIIGICSLILLLRAFFLISSNKSAKVSFSLDIRLVFGIIIFIVYILIVSPLGFCVTTVAFLFIFSIYQGGENLLTILVLSILITLLLYLMFSVWLKVDLPKGCIF